MSPLGLFVLIQLVDLDGQALDGLQTVDGRPQVNSLVDLEPGLHALGTAQGERLIHVPRTSAHEPILLRVQVHPRPGDYGLAMRSHDHLAESEPVPAVDLGQGPAVRPMGYDLAADLPEFIRVARYRDNNCASDFLRIDEVPLESYVAGVVNAEIGVFAAAGSGDGVQIPGDQRRDRVLASFQTFAVAARTYVVWWYLRQGETADYHIKDGPCNQVYRDDRTEISSAAATTTEGQILVAEFDRDLLDKHEYASSCARRGSLPSYKSANPVDPEDIIPDDGLERVCVRTWCGHDSERMAHQDNPLFPAGNRSLVRGICQWGSVERAVAGQSYLQILSHYQPLLELRSFGEEALTGGLVGEVTAAESGEPIARAQVIVSLAEDERTARSDREGHYEFTDLNPGSWDVWVRAEGYQPVEDRVLVEAGSVRRAHFLLLTLDVEGPVADAGPQSRPDAGERDRDGPVGCGCRQTGSGSIAWFLVLGIAIMARRPLRGARSHAKPPA